MLRIARYVVGNAIILLGVYVIDRRDRYDAIDAAQLLKPEQFR